MKNFQDFLTEGRDAPLYHGTSFDSLTEILRYDMIESRTHHVPHLLGHDDPNLMKISGVSLSREFKKARSFGTYVLELDQSKLIQKYKVRPVQWFATSKNEMISSRTIKNSITGIGKQTESEEFVVGSIKNLDKYLVNLWIPKSLESVEFDKDHWGPKQKIVFGNPKIKYY